MENLVEPEKQKPEEKKVPYDFEKQEEHSKHKVKYHNVLITLAALIVMPVYLYGYYVLVLALSGIIAAFLVDFICVKLFFRTTYKKGDYSSYVTALITVMLMPATVPIWVIVVTVAIGLFVAKYPFGGTGHNIFNPAAVGVAFAAICWPELVLRYPVPYTTYALPDMSGVQYANSPASVMRVGGTPKIDLFDIMLGRFAGPMGATCMIVLATCLLYLMFRRVVSKRIVFSAIFTVCIFVILFPRLITGEKASLIYELSSGALVFGVIFMANDPTTNPKTKGGRLFYGVLLGIFVIMFRYFGQIELEFVYAILLANVFAHSCDKYSDYLSLKLKALKEKAKSMKKQHKITEAGETDA